VVHEGSNACCPRCGGGFHCGADDAAPCPCNGLTLGPDTTRLLRERYDGCLCLRCLAQLQSGGDAGMKKPAQS
jgi:hypothetical protein